METENRSLLIEGAKALGIPLDARRVEAFDIYLKELLKWNRKINLTAIRTEKEIVLKHFLDSLSTYPYVSSISSLLDIGSGAGLPGIPLKIVEPSLEITLIDSTRKKVDFQRHIIRTLGLKGIEAIHGRVQDKEILHAMGQRFDAVISRGFSDLRTFLSLSLTFLKKGGTVLAMKGPVRSEEIQSLIQLEGSSYRLKKVSSFVLPFSSIKRSILLFEKV
ncbi:MAG: 16S rRNA (guanine(527)-N(7))-methyltransferase RsmG [Syntrophaceae bacterium]|nr:16S rRNA (guanine(527)-N(7))-methyltransferase RsmG [Syntrophaceae bacterium]